MEFRVLGPLEVVGETGPIELSPGSLEFLSVLLVRFGSVVPVDVMAEAIWGEDLPAKPMAALHTQVSRLRDALTPDRGRRDAGGVVVTVAGGYQLVAAEDDVDAGQFRRMLAAATSLLDVDPARAARLCGAALDMWRGPAYADFADREFAQAEIRSLDEARRVAQETRIAAEVASGGHREAVAEIEALLVEEPYRESLWGQLMLAQYRSGNQADALRAYQRVRVALVEELGLEPSRQLQQLEEAILLQDPDLDTDITVLRESEEIPDNIPVPIGTFVGRQGQVATVNEAIDSNRLVTLIGPGGIGKSRLAIEAVRTRSASQIDVVGFVRLDGLTDPDRITEAVLAALGLVSEASVADNALSLFLAPKRGLLILDGCETVITGAASFARELLEACAGLRILATSRQRLGLIGEYVWPVPFLELAVAGSSSEAVDLFLDRWGGRTVTDLEPEARETVSQLVSDLDGLPLAIELVASASHSLALSDVVTGVDALLDSETDHTALPNLESLRASLDWSWSMLSEPRREAVAMLSIFVDHWNLAGAAAVCSLDGEAAAAQLMAELTDLSVVVPDTQYGAATGWYRMIHIQHAYARQQLAQSGRAEAAALLHAQHYSRQFSGFKAMAGEGVAAGYAVNRSSQNLDAALQWSLDHQPDLALNIASTLAYWFTMEGRAADTLEFLERALAKNPEKTAERAESLIWTAVASFPRVLVRRPIVQFDHPYALLANRESKDASVRLARVEYALTQVQETIEIGQELEDARVETAGWAVRGLALGVVGRYEESKEALDRAIDAGKAEMAAPTYCVALNGQADWHIVRGDLDGARTYATAAVEAASRLGWMLRIWSLDTMTRIGRANGDTATAYETLCEAPALIPPEIGSGEAVTHTELGILAVQQNDLDTAFHHFGIALGAARRSGNDRAIAEVRFWQGYAELVAGRLENAREYLLRAAGIQRSQGDQIGMADSYAALGIIAYAHGDVVDAINLCQQSLQTWAQPSSSVVVVLEGLASVAGSSGDDRRAALLYGAAEAERERIFYPPNTFRLVTQQSEEIRSRLGPGEMERLLASGREIDRAEIISAAMQGSDINPR